MSREVRKVAVDWQHPKLDHKLFVPLLNGAWFERDLRRYEENKSMWDRGMVRDTANNDWITRGEAGVCESCFYSYYGDVPDALDYMPQWAPEDATHYMLYETNTRGTPLTPAFARRDELAAWCVENNITLCPTRKLTFTGWLKLAQGFTTGQLMRERINTVLLEEPEAMFA